MLRWLKDGTDVRALARGLRGLAGHRPPLTPARPGRLSPNDPPISLTSWIGSDAEVSLLCAWTALWCELTGSQPAPRPAATCGTHVLHKAFSGNVQVLTDHTGVPVWTAPVESGSTHDITAARAHALPALYRAASLGLPTLADEGYTGAGIGIKVPAKDPHPDPDTRWRNELITCM